MGQGRCHLLGVLLQGLGWVPLWGAPMAQQWDAFALPLHLVGRGQRFPEWCSGNSGRGGRGWRAERRGKAARGCRNLTPGPIDPSGEMLAGGSTNAWQHAEGCCGIPPALENPCCRIETPKSTSAAGWVWWRCREVLREGFGGSAEPEVRNSVALRF